MILKNYQYNVWLITCMFTLALKAESVNVMGSNFFLSGNLPAKTKWICICDGWRLYRKWNLRWRTSYVKGEPSILVFVITHTFWSMNWLCSLFLFLSQALNWNLSPITINSWLNIYLQLSCLASKNGKTPNFHLPDYPQQQFIQVTQVCNVFFYEMFKACLIYRYQV